MVPCAGTTNAAFEVWHHHQIDSDHTCHHNHEHLNKLLGTKCLRRFFSFPCLRNDSVFWQRVLMYREIWGKYGEARLKPYECLQSTHGHYIYILER